MIHTFVPVKVSDKAVGYIPLDKITFISPAPEGGGGYAYAWVDETRYALVKEWQSSHTHLYVGRPG